MNLTPRTCKVLRKKSVNRKKIVRMRKVKYGCQIMFYIEGVLNFKVKLQFLKSVIPTISA